VIQGENLFSIPRECFEKPKDFAIKNNDGILEEQGRLEETLDYVRVFSRTDRRTLWGLKSEHTISPQTVMKPRGNGKNRG